MIDVGSEALSLNRKGWGLESPPPKKKQKAGIHLSLGLFRRPNAAKELLLVVKDGGRRQPHNLLCPETNPKWRSIYGDRSIGGFS